MNVSTRAERPSAVLAYRAAEWNGIRLGRWRVSPGGLSERVYADHQINIPLSGRFTSVKHNPAGRRRRCHGAPDLLFGCTRSAPDDKRATRDPTPDFVFHSRGPGVMRLSNTRLSRV